MSKARAKTSGKSANGDASPKKRQIPLNQLQDKFISRLKTEGKSLNTLKNFRTDLDCFNQYLTQEQGNLVLDHFDIPQTLEYGGYLEKRYNSDNSRRRRVQSLRRFFDFLVAEGHFSYNPIKKIPTSPKFLDVPRPTPFKDIKKLWETLLDESLSEQTLPRLKAKRNMVLMLLIYGAGLKVSDLSSIKVSQLSTGKNPRVQINHPKRDSYTIPLPTIFSPVCKNYLQDLEKGKKNLDFDFDELLFNANAHNILAGGLSSRGLQVIFRHYRNQLNITLTPKSLRQSCIFKWLQLGHPESLIKEWMGVAPSYNLTPYKNHLQENIFGEGFLEHLYHHKTT